MICKLWSLYDQLHFLSQDLIEHLASKNNTFTNSKVASTSRNVIHWQKWWAPFDPYLYEASLFCELIGKTGCRLLLFRNQQFMIVRYSNKSCLTKIWLWMYQYLVSLFSFFARHMFLVLLFHSRFSSLPGNFITALKFTSHARLIRLRICELLSTDAGAHAIVAAGWRRHTETSQFSSQIHIQTRRHTPSSHKCIYKDKHEDTHICLATRPDTCATGKFGEIFSSLWALEVRQKNTVYWDPVVKYDYCWDFNLTKREFHHYLDKGDQPNLTTNDVQALNIIKIY